jgi:hypothetical protein
LKVKCDKPLSNVAFNFNLRRYNEAEQDALRKQLHEVTSELDVIYDAISRELGKFGVEMKGSYVEALRRGRAVQVDSIKTRVESAPGVCNQRLKLKCDEPLSNDTFNFNLRRYTEGVRNTCGR